MAIIIIRILTPNRYFEILGFSEVFWLFLAEKLITK